MIKQHAHYSIYEHDLSGTYFINHYFRTIGDPVLRRETVYFNIVSEKEAEELCATLTKFAKYLEE